MIGRTRTLQVARKDWPVAGTFRISRSNLSVIPTVQVTLQDGEHVGRAECRPYARYDQTVDSVSAQIESLRGAVENGLTRETLQSALPAGPARNALDCALWDLDAKQSGRTIAQLLGVAEPKPRQTAFTLSVDTPDAMARAAEDAEVHTLLKVKLGGEAILPSLDAICAARPDAQLIVDANEAFDAAGFAALYERLCAYPIVMLEQPLPALSADTLPRGPLAICADESLHTADDLDRLWAQGFRAVNVKLDKCGGLTAAHKLMQRAEAMGFDIMAGCMVGSSLAMAPMMVLESNAQVIDLDGPLLLASDESDGLVYEDGRVNPPARALWG